MAADDVEPVLADFSLYPRRLLLANVDTLDSPRFTPTLFPDDDDAIRLVNGKEDTGCLLVLPDHSSYFCLLANRSKPLHCSPPQLVEVDANTIDSLP